MKKIKLTQPAYVAGTMENPYYTAAAEDINRESYTVVWEITKMDCFNNGDEDCCDWDSYTVYRDGYPSTPIDAEVIWE